MRSASLVAMALPTASPISSLKYGKCHWSGASTTPSSEMKKLDTILPTWALLVSGATTSGAAQ